jgi:putative lipase involved disintegration of autophagic bodies
MWLTGHSLGGALASLTGLTFGVPTVTFECPPDRLASQRLHLPSPPGMKPEDMLIWHFGHTADPLYLGVCTVCSLVRSLIGRDLLLLVGMLGMLWSRLVILGWSVCMIRLRIWDGECRCRIIGLNLLSMMYWRDIMILQGVRLLRIA